jgi:hypothetical protein
MILVSHFRELVTQRLAIFDTDRPQHCCSKRLQSA